MDVAPGVSPSLPIRLRQRRSRPNALLFLLMVCALAFTLAGFGVYELVTGSRTIGLGGSMSDVGSIVWMTPLFAIGAIVLIGDRGPLRRLFLPRDTVEIAGIGLSWWTLSVAPGRMDWDEVGGISQTGFRDGTLTIVYSPQGRPIVTLEGEFLGERSRRSYPVPTAVAAAMPTVFEPIDPHHPERGCVRRGLSVSGEPRSAP